jgi:tRNA (Thr-GGU) A37 N-methylase
VPVAETRSIDGRVLCAACLFAGTAPFAVYPIGVVRNDQTRSNTRFGIQGQSPHSRIELWPSQKRFLYRIAEETHLTVVYYLHRTRPLSSVIHRGVDNKQVGIYASRTPDRPSRIAVSQVQLVSVAETTLVVEGLDAVDGSPVLDIKLGRQALR